MEYLHDLGSEIRSIAGEYRLDQEGRLEYRGREVLYVLGHAVFDTTCCGTGGCRFALVPGYLTTYRARQNDRGVWISEVDPISDQEARDEISGLLKQKDFVQQVQFS
jgi:hypothetical protein